MEGNINVTIYQLTTESIIVEEAVIPVSIFELAVAVGKIRYDGRDYEIYSAIVGIHEASVITVK